MKNVPKRVYCAILSFMFVFLCIGYASLTTTLSATGTASIVPPQDVYIVSVELISSTLSEESSNRIFPTNLDVMLNGLNGSTVTYKITVLNNTNYKYAYAGIDYEANLDGYEGNAYIGVKNGITVMTKENVSDKSSTFNSSDSLAPREKRSFYATYTIGSQAAGKELKTLINYKFGVHVDSAGAVIIDSAFEQFVKILNDTSEGGGYETLTDKIDDKYDGVNAWKANYIGNVVDSSGTDTKTINDLFGDNLSITIDGKKTDITLLIKRENVDGNENTGDSYTARSGNRTTTGTGCEMTLYMTTDKLQNGTPTVYAAVFTCDKNSDGTYGEWYMIGDMYTGTANIVGYEGGQSTGSFDTGTWRSSTSTYTVTDDYSYRVTRGNTIQTVIQAKDTTLTNKFKNILSTSKDVLDGKYGDFAGDAMVYLSEVYAKAARCYTVNTDGTVTVKTGVTRAQLVPLIKEFTTALKPFESVING